MKNNLDWTGNRQTVFTKIGASNHSTLDREIHDYYATDPKAVEELLKREKFTPLVWECACGGGHISKVLEDHNYTVRKSDIIDRGVEGTEILDFLTFEGKVDYDIVTNPPYKYAQEFVKKAMDSVTEKNKVAMLLKITFLEGKKRQQLFKTYPPKTIYVFSYRVNCVRNGDFENYPWNNAICYAWYIWEKGYKGDPVIKWI